MTRSGTNGCVAVPTSQHGPSPTSVPQNLQQARFVFVHDDSQGTPLQKHHEGPFKVIQHGHKAVQIKRGGRMDTISVDWLKPAHLLLE